MIMLLDRILDGVDSNLSMDTKVASKVKVFKKDKRNISDHELKVDI